MNKLLASVGASGALMLAVMSSPAWASAPVPPADSSSQQTQDKHAPRADDVPAPPMALLFGIGAVGLVWGRRLAAGARKAREQAESPD